jgi:hypothetical protein
MSAPLDNADAASSNAASAEAKKKLRKKLAKHYEESLRTQKVVSQPTRRQELDTNGLVLRDAFGINPDEKSIVETKVKHLLGQHNELELMPWKMLQNASEIGAELIALKEKVYHGQWTEFCRQSFASLSQRKIDRYMQLARNKERLLDKYKTDTRVDFEELPPIRQALADIQTWNQQEPDRQGKVSTCHKPAIKQKHGHHRTIEAETVSVVSPPIAQESFSVELPLVEIISPRLLRMLCPECLTKLRDAASSACPQKEVA